jgi:hypothetical protein
MPFPAQVRPPASFDSSPIAPFDAASRARAASLPGGHAGSRPAERALLRSFAAVLEGRQPSISSSLFPEGQPARHSDGHRPSRDEARRGSADAERREPEMEPKTETDEAWRLLPRFAFLAGERMPFAHTEGDPATRTASTVEAGSASVARGAAGSIETLLPEFVRRIAWSSDRRNGAVDLELGKGALEGARLLLTTAGTSVRARLEAPPGVDGDAWAERIRNRFHARGIALEAIDVCVRR